jgi:hypothetical protein
MVAADLKIFEEVLVALPKGRGDGHDDPFPDVLEAVLVEVNAGQRKLHPPKQEKVRRHKV